MAAQSLVLCRDPETLGVLRPLLSEFEMGVEVCLGLTGARRVLHRPDLKTVIVDCDEDGVGFEFLETLRRERPDSAPVVVGIVNDYSALQLAFAHGANFVLSKPIPAEDAKRILRMAQGFVNRMVRRFLRIAVHRLAHVRLSNIAEPAFLLDLGEGGLAVQALEPLRCGDRFDLGFLLPGTTAEITGSGQVIWADSSGRAGIEFLEIRDEARARLKQWIVEHAEPVVPQAAAKGISAGEEEIFESEPEKVPQPAPVFEQFDMPVEAHSGPSRRVPTASWIRIAARALDAAFILASIAAFWFVVFARLGELPSVRWMTALGCLMAAVIATAYFSLFFFFDLPFPGTRLMNALFSVAVETSEAHPLEVETFR
jgi:CheY-like chemotaxis protein